MDGISFTGNAVLSASLVNNLVAKPSTAKTINALLDVIQVKIFTMLTF